MSTLSPPTLPLSPQSIVATLAEAINASDLETAGHCFTKDACFVTPDSTSIRGRDEIRPILAQLIARRSRIEVLSSSVQVGGEVALISGRWAIRSAGPGDAVFEQEVAPTLVARRVEGRWKLAVAVLWGQAP